MPIELDPSLPPSLYPLAWLQGSWSGFGAVHVRGADGLVHEKRLEQSLSCTANSDGTMAWHCVSHLVNAPAPLPPTSAFSADPAAVTVPHSDLDAAERSVLLNESGIWHVGDPLPGQDLKAARAAAPGDPAAMISYELSATFRAGDEEAQWSGEVRGPRIQLAVRTPAGLVRETRMFGYIQGRMMWLWERRDLDVEGQEFEPYMSVELDRA